MDFFLSSIFSQALTEGDLITIWHRGTSHTLRVASLRPEPKGTLVDTDVEVDLDVSEEFKRTDEYNDLVRSELGDVGNIGNNRSIGGNISSSGRRIDGSAGTGDNSSSGISSSGSSSSSSSSLSSRSSGSSDKSDGRVVNFTPSPDLMMALPPEPPAGAPTILVRIRTPLMGKPLARAFAPETRLSALFLFVRASVGTQSLAPQQRFRLGTRFPSRSLMEGDAACDATLQEAGVAPQEVFLMTLVDA
jgi:hypothetical protein